MATIKSFTSLEQSRKLAEILPTESADMFWRYNHNIHTYDDIPKMLVVNNWDDDYNKNIPCWSLAALISALPNTIGRYYKTLGWFDNDWHCIYMDEDGETIGDDMGADNPVDACYEMIIHLNELNLL